MHVRVFADHPSLALSAASSAAERIRSAITSAGEARIIAATGVSQMAFLDALTRQPDIGWSKVEMFHLDEYVGISADHPASFRKYLRERLIEPTGISASTCSRPIAIRARCAGRSGVSSRPQAR